MLRAPNLYHAARARKSGKTVEDVAKEAAAQRAKGYLENVATGEHLDALASAHLELAPDISKGPPVTAEIEAMQLPKRLLNDIWMVWCVIDRDHNNDLSTEELAQALAAFGHHLDRYEVEDMLREVRCHLSSGTVARVGAGHDLLC